jgi:hypothetical protein
MNGRQVTVVVITIGSHEQKRLVTFRRRLAGLTKKTTVWRSHFSRIFEEVLTVPGLIFKINTLGGSISSDVKGRLSASHLPLSERVSSILGIALARGCSSRGDRSDAQSYCASRGQKPLRRVSGPSFRRLANGLLRRRKLRAPPATKIAVRS